MYMYLVVVLEGLVVVLLDMERPGQLVAAFSLHRLHLCTVEGMESQVLDFSVVLVGGGRERERGREGDREREEGERKRGREREGGREKGRAKVD